jgi:ATP/maltotriose-dependent transcriptional regulator MalT
MEARALARAGDAAACQRALAQAATALDQHIDGDEDPEWIAYFDQAELSAEFGHCFRDLAMPGQAAEHAKVSICGSSARSDFFVTIVLADALLAQGDDEQACAVALQALDAGEQLKSARCLTYLSDFRARLDRLGNARTVRIFREQAAGSRLWQRAS